MSVLKVIEIMGNSKESFEDTAQKVIIDAVETVEDIKSMQVRVEKNQVA